MSNLTRSLELDEELITIYNQAPEETRRQLQARLTLYLRELAAPTGETRAHLFDRVSDYAESQGLTEQVLSTLLYPHHTTLAQQ